MTDIFKDIEIVLACRQPCENCAIFIPPCRIDVSRFIWHQVLPVSYGGLNNAENLVLMERRQHEIFHHYYLDPQLNSLKIGEERLILLPRNYDMNSKSFKRYRRYFLKSYKRYVRECNNYKERQR